MEGRHSLDRLRTLCQRISALTKEQHQDVYKIVQQSRIPISQNDTDVFIDLVSLPASIIRELEELVHLSTTALHLSESNPSTNAVPPSTEETGEASKRWDSKINSQPILDRAGELVKRHLFRGGDIPSGTATRDPVASTKRRAPSKRTFIASAKRSDVYEPQNNELDEVPIVFGQ
jgi:hypothetical protein